MNDNEMRFLIYKIGDEVYGSPLLSVREVLEFQKPKFMPNMVSYFVGVINVRGAIVGVIDMRSKFGVPETIKGGQTAMLLCDTDKGPIAAIVDAVESVQLIEEKELEKKPPVQSRVNKNYMIGVAKNKDRLVTIVDLLRSLADEELKVA